MIFGKRKRQRKEVNKKLYDLNKAVKSLSERNSMLEHILFECCFDNTKEGKCRYKIGDIVFHKEEKNMFCIERVLFIPHSKEVKYLLRGHYSANEHGLSDEGDIDLISRAYSEVSSKPEVTPKTK